MTDTERKGIYAKLSPKSKDFVDFYVENILKIPKYKENKEYIEEKENIISKNPKVFGNMQKLIEKKYINSKNVSHETFFENLNPDFYNFLFPNYENTILNGLEMKDMQKTVEKIVNSILEKKKICIYSDYDCDGVPGISMMRDFFEMINYNLVSYYIPHRHNEGYGLNKKAIEKIKEEGNDLIITIDLGITNYEEIDFANNLGMEVIVTDHHLPIESEDGEILPKAYSILNHKQSSCNYPEKVLCGSGIVFKLILEIIKYARKNSIWEIKTGSEKWLLDLVGIATIADMVPLVGENRLFANYGLAVLKKTKRQGLRQLLKNSKTSLENINEDDIAFSIAPRVNAASRMDHPVHAFKMFSMNTKEGIDNAHYLESLNTDRKESVASIIKKVNIILQEKILREKLPNIIVIGSADWGAGVLGIVASNVLEKYNRSVFVWGGEEDGEYKGSCRSLGDIHVVKLMNATKDLFNHFGGHESAGGFSISFQKIHFLEKELNQNYEKAKIKSLEEIALQKIEEKEIGNIKNISLAIQLEDITSEFLKGLSLISPFGIGNAKPIFTITNIENFEVKRFGKKNEHLKIILQSRTTKREAIKFFVDSEKEKSITQNINTLFFNLESGYKNGLPRLKILS